MGEQFPRFPEPREPDPIEDLAVPGDGVAIPRFSNKKEEERERKGAALPWWGAAGQASPGSWGAGQAGAALARGGAVGARVGWRALLSGQPAWFLGAAALLGISALMMGGGALWNTANPEIRYGAFAYSEPLRDAVRAASPKPVESSLALAGREEPAAAQAQDGAPAEAAEEPAPAPEINMDKAVADAAAAAESFEGPIEGRRDWTQVARLARNDFLSGGGRGFAAGAGFGPKSAALAKPGDQVPLRGASLGQAKAMPGARRATSAAGLRVRNATAGRAMGQLKFADRLSNSASVAKDGNASRGFAADAFDQAQTIGGGAESIGGGGMSDMPGTGLGGGAPNMLTDARSTNVPGKNATPYQDQLDKSRQESNQAKILMVIGAALLAIGGLLALIGKKLMSNPLTASQGKMVLIMGLGLMVAGAAMLAAGAMMGKSAKDRGKDVGERSGQKEQGELLQDCADQALGKQDCKPKPVEQPGSSVQADVAAERDANYTLK